MRILLVEDEAPLRETLAARLKREGFAVDAAQAARLDPASNRQAKPVARIRRERRGRGIGVRPVRGEGSGVPAAEQPRYGAQSWSRAVNPV